jgi:glycosyltransferase involved in cell wall biosynthesis
MRVLYDGNIYLMQAAGGVNRYFANLVSRLPADVTPYLTLCGNPEVNYPIQPRMKVYNYRRFRPAAVSYRLEKLYFNYVASARRYDLAHPTYYTLLSRQELSAYRCPVVITVWDMIHELFPAELDPAGRHAEEKRKAIMAAQAVICISENTRNDLLERYPVDERKVKVTPLAAGIDASQAHGPEPVPDRPYFLYVGMRYGYKNFDGLLTAFASVHRGRPGTSLCVVGAPFSQSEMRTIVELGLTNAVEFYGYVSDPHLAKLYHYSLAFVYPSLYEGFGIPPLEAMACGAPVVASNRSSLPEVVGDAGLLFDPEKTSDLTDILLLLNDSLSQREQLIAKGRQRAKVFSWEKTVAQTMEVYRAVSGAAERSN